MTCKLWLKQICVPILSQSASNRLMTSPAVKQPIPQNQGAPRPGCGTGRQCRTGCRWQWSPAHTWERHRDHNGGAANGAEKGHPLQSGSEGLHTGRQASTSESAPRGGMPSGSLRRGPPPGAPESQAPTPPIPGRPLQCLLPYSRRQSPAVTPLRHAVGLVQADERQLVRHPLQLLEERRRAPAFDGGWRATMGRPPPTHCPPPAGGDWVGLCLAGGPWGKAVNARRPFGGGDPRRFFLCKPFSRLDTSETKELLCFSFDPSPGCIPWSPAITRR